MTDLETFAAIVADFPFDTERLDSLHGRLDALLNKTQNNGWTFSTADKTIDQKSWLRLRVLTWAIRDLVAAMDLIERDGDPDEFIPF
jgi:hypothetical protein